MAVYLSQSASGEHDTVNHTEPLKLPALDLVRDDARTDSIVRLLLISYRERENIVSPQTVISPFTIY